MFNEAFWFFYWVGVVGDISAMLGMLMVGLIIFLVCWSIFGGFAVTDGKLEKSTWSNGYKYAVIAFVVLCFVDTVIPNEKALYAGAGQYVGEAAEIDDTLLKLKDLIDQKIEETTKTGKSND